MREFFETCKDIGLALLGLAVLIALAIIMFLGVWTAANLLFDDDENYNYPRHELSTIRVCNGETYYVYPGREISCHLPKDK